LTVLWLSAALTVIGFSLATTIRGETDRTSTALDGLRSYYLAAAGVDRASLEALWGLEAPGSRTIPEHATQVTYHFASGDVRVEFIPANAKLNVNRATLEDLTRLGIALGLDEVRADALAHALEGARSPGGAVGGGIEGVPSFPSPGASLQEIEELLSVPGITPELFYGTYLPRQDEAGTVHLVRRPGLVDCLTVYGIHNDVDANTAEPAVLAAIGMPPDAIAALVARRSQAPILPDQLASVAATTGQGSARLSVGGHSIVTMRATARLRLPDGTFSSLRRTLAATVKYMPPGYPTDAPIHILRWYDTAWSD
jgi:general secretion pathway protein K